VSASNVGDASVAPDLIDDLTGGDDVDDRPRSEDLPHSDSPSSNDSGSRLVVRAERAGGR
jgi:hypothetical protein